MLKILREATFLKYLQHTKISSVRNEYDNIIGWGTGPIFKMNYRKEYFGLDFLVDGTGKQVGETIFDIPVKNENALDGLSGKTLIVIYAIYEHEIIGQIKNHLRDNVDTIIYPLLDVDIEAGLNVQHMNAKTCEDFLALMAIRQLGLQSLSYLEIGVCHPVMRNNTWLLREQFRMTPEYHGVLVEANPLCWDLIKEYRPEDKLCEMGVTDGVHGGKTKFYAFPEMLGHSTFVKELAEQTVSYGKHCEEYNIQTQNINYIIEKNFTGTPDLLALDAEGLDYKILFSWDKERFPFKIVIAEAMDTTNESLRTLMTSRGYYEYARTPENAIWLRNDCKIFI